MVIVVSSNIILILFFFFDTSTMSNSAGDVEFPKHMGCNGGRLLAVPRFHGIEGYLRVIN